MFFGRGPKPKSMGTIGADARAARKAGSGSASTIGTSIVDFGDGAILGRSTGSSGSASSTVFQLITP